MHLGGLKRVKSLELMMRESSVLNNQQSSSLSNTPNEVSTLGSDKEILSTTQEELTPLARGGSNKAYNFFLLLFCIV